MWIRLTVCYDGKTEERIIKAHILKATETLATLCTPLIDELHSKNKSTYEKECLEGQSDKPKIRLSVLFPSAVDPRSVWEFIRETYHCEQLDKPSLYFGLFEKPYK